MPIHLSTVWIQKIIRIMQLSETVANYVFSVRKYLYLTEIRFGVIEVCEVINI